MQQKEAQKLKKGDRIYLQALKTKVKIAVVRVKELDQDRVSVEVLDSTKIIFSKTALIEYENPKTPK